MHVSSETTSLRTLDDVESRRIVRRPSILVPNVLGTKPELVEELYTLATTVPSDEAVVLDMSAVTWINPYGATSLLGACRFLKQLVQEPVHLTGLRRDVHAYLRRIDFFERGHDIVLATDRFDSCHELGRSSLSSNVLELFPIRVQRDVLTVASRGRRILTSWLGNATYDIDRVVNLIAEACSNIVDHSGDQGIIMIQKYEHTPFITIELAISDLGKGIRNTLLAKHGNISDTCSGFIERALDGLSARPGERGGQGLGVIQRIAIASGGTLHVRSEMGSVWTEPAGKVPRDDLPFFPGTHIAIKFRSNRFG
jgi:anti-sigma regulatory factor (Ser/Thr protein kinase)/anti-anti-sigma regulatory factor